MSDEIAELFRAALISATGDDSMMGRLSLNSLLASAQDNPELDAVIRDVFPACDEPIVKRAADWGQELADHERSLRERIAADIEAAAPRDEFYDCDCQCIRTSAASVCARLVRGNQ